MCYYGGIILTVVPDSQIGDGGVLTGSLIISVRFQEHTHRLLAVGVHLGGLLRL